LTILLKKKSLIKIFKRKKSERKNKKDLKGALDSAQKASHEKKKLSSIKKQQEKLSQSQTHDLKHI
jgi:hypothetical protein